MMEPYKITGPTCLSFSGGRTSAYMLRKTLDANTLEDLKLWLVVCFANTGKEDEATLRFVDRCDREWMAPLGLAIVWVEFRADEPRFAVVGYATASRDGEPFEAAIRKRNYLPNPVTRFCTVELKIRTMHKYLRSFGWADGDGWNQFVGIRADEQRRVAKIRARPSPETVKETMCMPLADDGVTVETIQAFWEAQPFGLELPTYRGRTLAGNCDLCFLKPAGQVLSLINQKPERATWWVRMEALALASKPSGARFRSDRASYAQMQANASDQADAFGFEEEGIPCFCGD